MRHVTHDHPGGHVHPGATRRADLALWRPLTARYALGEGSSAAPVGNPVPLAINVRPGSEFAPSARLGQRHLGSFDVAGSAVGIRCSVDTAGAGAGSAAVLVDGPPGTTVVSTSTGDCTACAGIHWRRASR
jgi:hypothetical protein